MQLRNYVRNNKSTMAGAELRFQQLSEYIYIILLSLSRDGTIVYHSFDILYNVNKVQYAHTVQHVFLLKFMNKSE